MYCSHQYLSIDPQKSLPRPLYSPQAAHKLQKIVHMNEDISEIENWDFRFRFRSPLERPQTAQISGAHNFIAR